jgi:hypothetical protein
MKRIFYEKIRGLSDESFTQVLSQMVKVDHPVLCKRIVVTSAFAAMLFTASSFTFGPVDASLVADAPQKKEQHVKVVINQDGKETKIDTTFNLSDEKMINFKVDSMLKKLDIKGIENEASDMVVLLGEKARYWNQLSRENMPRTEQFDILIQNGDSGKVMHKRKIVRLAEGNDNLSDGDDPGDNLMPPPPPPPVPPFPLEYHQRFNFDPFALDPNDDAIISYDKKDIGKGLEKITIIRKKQNKEQNRDVNVKVDVSDEQKK